MKLTHYYIASLILLFINFASINAQVGTPRNDFSVGLNAGYLTTKMDFDPTIKQSYKSSPTFGFTARYICEKYFTTICGVQLEVNFANLGWEEVIEDGSGNTYSRNLTYIQVPMLMQMGWGYEQKGCKFIFEAGPQLGYNISSKEIFGGGTWNTSDYFYRTFPYGWKILFRS